jgi:diguanylate cyclase (GGDEF)-like protein
MSIRNAAGLIVAGVAVFQDVTERNEGDALVRHMALHDSLTGLPNRDLFHDWLAQALARARRVSAGGGPGEEQQVAVMLLDLDGFKDVNDALGHETGDRLLHAVATCLGAAIRVSDTLARLGGDEFTLVLPDLRRPADAAALAEKMLRELAAPCALDGETFHVTTSLGIALFPGDGADGEALLRQADLALYRAKAQGRNRFRFFEPGMDVQAQARRRPERELRLALERGEFVLHYQP